MFRNSAVVKNSDSEFLKSNEENTYDNSYQGSIPENIEAKGSIISNISGDMQPIAKEFRQHYERKLREICEDNKDDCIQAKMKLQEDWIRDLTEQNDMLIKAVIELESEATQRVKILEGKLKESAACACEVMNGWRGRAEANAQQHFQTQEQLASDVRSLLKLLRKARTTTGDVSALTIDTHFHHVSAQELNDALQLNEAEIDEQAQVASTTKDRKIEQLQMNLVHSANTRFEETDQFRMMQENYSLLQQTMQDVRDALTAEVADKHDVIVTLRRDVQLLEEQCRRADQQTHFKDDIIKELRKDLKHFKQEIELYRSKKLPSYSNALSHITYIPMTACLGRIAAELQCTAAQAKCEHRRHSFPARNYYGQQKRLTPTQDLYEEPELLKNDKKDDVTFAVVHKHSPKHAPNLHRTNSSHLPSNCYTDKPKKTIFTDVKETVSTARAVVDYLDLSISEGKILSEANRIMKRRQIKMLEMDK